MAWVQFKQKFYFWWTIPLILNAKYIFFFWMGVKYDLDTFLKAFMKFTQEHKQLKKVFPQT